MINGPWRSHPLRSAETGRSFPQLPRPIRETSQGPVTPESQRSGPFDLPLGRRQTGPLHRADAVSCLSSGTSRSHTERISATDLRSIAVALVRQPQRTRRHAGPLSRQQSLRPLTLSRFVRISSVSSDALAHGSRMPLRIQRRPSFPSVPMKRNDRNPCGIPGARRGGASGDLKSRS